LFRGAREAEAIEPDIARAFAAARVDTLATSRRMWQSLADDGLLHPDVDLDWIAETTGLLAAADTYLLIQATLHWTPDQLRSWLYRTWIHLATTPGPPRRSGEAGRRGARSAVDAAQPVAGAVDGDDVAVVQQSVEDGGGENLPG
jgi:hypothetical protein